MSTEAAWYFPTQRWLRWLLGEYWPTRVQGASLVPAEGPVIFSGNHPTVLDGLILALHAPRRVRFLVRGDVMRLPVLGPFLRGLGAITVHRGGDSLQQARMSLGRGHCLGIFPEADPTFQLQLREFRRGGAVLARDTGASVVPFALRGPEKLAGRCARYLGSGPVELHFGCPLRAEPQETVEALTQRIRRGVQQLLDSPPLAPAVSTRGLRFACTSALVVPTSALFLRLGPSPSQPLD